MDAHALRHARRKPGATAENLAQAGELVCARVKQARKHRCGARGQVERRGRYAGQLGDKGRACMGHGDSAARDKRRK